MKKLTQRQQAIEWWNTLGITKQDEISLDHYGTLSYCLMDDEIETIWLKEAPQKKVYTEEELHQLFEKLVVRGAFKSNRDYEIAKKTLLELTSIDYEAEIN